MSDSDRAQQLLSRSKSYFPPNILSALSKLCPGNAIEINSGLKRDVAEAQPNAER
jgi:hypothetical protein